MITTSAVVMSFLDVHDMPTDRSSRRLLAAFEPLRAGMELAALGVSALPLALAPRGDGHRVLVLPGLGASDVSTAVLRRYLSFLGYEALPWELGRNLGFAQRWDALEERFTTLLDAACAAGKDVSVVGQSLGGTMAIRLAARFPGHLRRVVTLGSPVTGSAAGVQPLVRAMYRRFNGVPNGSNGVGAGGAMPAGEADGATRASADAISDTNNIAGPRITTIFSRTDGIVPWELAHREDGDAEAIEVRGSHFGMASNAGVLYAVADRLAEKAGRRFAAPALLQGYFP